MLIITLQEVFYPNLVMGEIHTTLMKLSVRAPVGDINIANDSCCIGRGLAALNSKFGSNSHLFMLMKELKPIFDVFNGNGTTFGALTKDTLWDIKIVIPNGSVLQK